jgi:hypothetical protein
VKINFFIGDDYHTWNNHHETYIVREDQVVYFELTDSDNNEIPVLFVEDYELNLTVEYEGNFRLFRSVSGCLFRESFGLAIVNIHIGEQRFEIRFEVIIKKVNAQQVEDMIHYLTQKQQDILRICLIGENEKNTSDPDTLLNTVETFINTLISCRLELQYHLRKRLIPIRQPAWKSSQGSDIDPFDIMLNLDTLEPVLGDGDVVFNGRSFAIKGIEVTTLETTVNVKENAILLGGIYSMYRIISALFDDINTGFTNSKVILNNSEYESLSNVLLRLTSANMKQRCEAQLLRLEEFIRYFEKTLGIHYQGEQRPIMTPFVRASRVYRRLFEQLYEWYALNESSLDGRHYLAKLRSVSKIYEFVSLFKLIDYLHGKNWTVIETQWSSDLEFIPSRVIFERNELTLTLSYESKVFSYSTDTKHLELVDMKHGRSNGDYNYWCPDFILRLDTLNKTVYFILDAKYSSAETVKLFHLPSLLNKYFVNMAVYDAYNELLKQDAILGVIALFPDKYSLPVYMSNWGKYGIHKKPIRLPIVTGLPILPQSDSVTHRVFDQLFELAERHILL